VADIFVSYTRSDRDWAFWIAEELRVLGHAPRVHEWELKGGDDIYAWMEQRHDAADHVLCVVSDEYLKAPYSTLERNAAITTALARYEGRVAITALHGLRGVGKTTLAAVYAERHRGDYRATWWIRAQTESTMRADLVGLGVRLKWVAGDEKEEPAIAAVLERLRNEGAGCLLIYDNAPDAEALRPYLPRGGAARVLITSNAHTWRGIAEPVEIRLWPKEVGADYLIARTGRSAERFAAEVLSEVLGGLPLAHEQAAAYCERLNVSLADYTERFAAAPARFLDDARHAPHEYHDGLTVAKTFALAIEEAAKLHPAAEPLLIHAALLAPEPIPLFLFAEGRGKLSEPLASALDGEGLDEAVAALRVFALVDIETVADERDPEIKSDCIRLHLLVRQVAATRLDLQTRDEMLRALTQATAAIYPKKIRDPQAWPRARRLDTLVLGLVCGEALPRGVEETAVQLLTSAGYYWQSAIGAYERARPLFERALAVAGKVFGPEHPMSLNSLSNLAHMLMDQGNDLAAARLLFERALAITERVLGPEHPRMATSLNDLALLLHHQGDLAAARPLYERALTINEQVLGTEDPATASNLYNLAQLFRDQGDPAAARPLIERGLAITEKVLGPEHPDTATNLIGLAGLLQELGDLAEARPLLERALAVREKFFGFENHNTTIILGNFARLLRDQGDLAAARLLYERALAATERMLGYNDTIGNSALLGFASVLVEFLTPGFLAEALPAAEAVLAISRRAFGDEHSSTQGSARITAAVLVSLGRTEEASALCTKYGITDQSE
jgi:tetratricopeptide (TPR) repeat protein